MTLLDTLAAGNASTRLHTALTAGTRPDPAHARALITRCAVEPDFFVRDMLTWALTRLPTHTTVPLLLTELRSDHPQARSQALHTLSKIADPATWPAITPALLHDPDDDVARAAWRAAVTLAPDHDQPALAGELATELGRGDHTRQLSLSQALAALGDHTDTALQTALTSDNPAVRTHAHTTVRLRDDPDTAFEPAIGEATRIAALNHLQNSPDHHSPATPHPTGHTPC